MFKVQTFGKHAVKRIKKEAPTVYYAKENYVEFTKTIYLIKKM